MHASTPESAGGRDASGRGYKHDGRTRAEHAGACRKDQSTPENVKASARRRDQRRKKTRKQKDGTIIVIMGP